MKLEFESIEEVKDFVTKLKGTRGGKADKDGETETATGTTAPAPLAPPTGQAFNPNSAAAFAPPAGGAAPQGAGPFAQGAAGPAPEVLALVSRINTRMDAALASGQPADQALSWLRGQIGPDAAQATMEQAQKVLLPKLSVPQLEAVAKLMNA